MAGQQETSRIRRRQEIMNDDHLRFVRDALYKSGKMGVSMETVFTDWLVYVNGDDQAPALGLDYYRAHFMAYLSVVLNEDDSVSFDGLRLYIIEHPENLTETERVQFWQGKELAILALRDAMTPEPVQVVADIDAEGIDEDSDATGGGVDGSDAEGIDEDSDAEDSEADAAV